jgi:Tfp pilus assembly protein PilX
MNPWLILGFMLAITVSGGVGMYQGKGLGKAEVQQKWDRERAAQEAEYALAQEEARAKEQALQANADAIRQEKDREIRDLNARATAIANSVRDRPERPTTQASTVSGTASAGCAPTACTGAGLSREDALFLTGEAARGAEAVALLKQCRAQYEAIRH